MNEEVNQPPPIKKSNTVKYVGIGCLALFIFGLVSTYFAVVGVKKFINTAVNEYTAEQPATLPGPPGTEQSSQAVITRVDEFTKGLENGQSVETLSLTADEINLLINFHPEWKEVAGTIFISINNDKLSGDVSFPMDKMGMPIFEGRYLNGSATISIELKDDRFLVFLEALEANGKAVPKEVMKQFRSENLAKDLNKNPNTQQVFEKLKSISVKDGKIHLVPKAAAGGN